jgi:hypothetical protein
MKAEFRPSTLVSIKLLPKKQVLHRSRDVALAVRKLQINEVNHRISRINDGRHWVNQLKEQVTQAQLTEIAALIGDTTHKAMRFDLATLAKYIKEHENSSLGSGLHWGELTVLDRSAWRRVFEAEKAFVERAYLGDGPSMYYSRPYNLGLRARANPLNSVPTAMEYEQSGEIDRTRIVTFDPAPSSVSAWMPDKVQWYKEILTQTEDILGINSKIHYPMLEGGQIYVAARDLLLAGYRHHAFDGGSWEAVVGEVTRGPMNIYSTQFGDLNVLPSGITFTSLLGTILSLIAMKRWGQPDQTEYIILGDDINVFSKKGLERFSEAGDLVAYQPEDSATEFVLGVAYVYDREEPRIQGIKLTVDRADKARHLDWGGLELGTAQEDRGPGSFDETYIGTADERTTALWNGLAHGQFGKGTLLKRLELRKAQEFRGGSEEIHKLALEDYEHLTLEEAEAWMS